MRHPDYDGNLQAEVSEWEDAILTPLHRRAEESTSSSWSTDGEYQVQQQSREEEEERTARRRQHRELAGNWTNGGNSSAAVEEKPAAPQQQQQQQQQDPYYDSEGNRSERSRIHYVDSPNGRRREGHLAVLLPLSEDIPNRELIDFRVYIELSAFLAFQHIQHRSSFVLPGIQKRLDACDFQWTYEHYDTQFSPIQAARGLLKSQGMLLGEANQVNASSVQEPFALLGAARSVVSQTVGLLSDAMELPLMSPSSTSTSLNDLQLFARTIPTDTADSQSILAYLNHLGVDQVTLLFADDTWGRSYESHFRRYSEQYKINVHYVPYLDEHNMDAAFRQLKRSGVRYTVGILYSSSWRSVLSQAHRWGLVGNREHQWFLADIIELSGGQIKVNRETERDLVQALQGLGVLAMKVPYNADFVRALATFEADPSQQQQFIEAHSEKELFEGFEFDYHPERTVYEYLAYDAVIALGLTACETPGLFTGLEFYNKLLEMDFEGVSGRVRFDNKTGTRLGDGLDYTIVNLVLGGESNDTVYFDAKTSTTIDLSPVMHDETGLSKPIIIANSPFLYYGNTTIPPPSLPSPNVDMRLIPQGYRIFGLTMAAIVMALSLACGVWSAVRSDLYVIKAAQPFFLIQICVGTFIIASSVIFMSFQEDMSGLDQACVAIPWLLNVGFCISISALYSKGRRINTLMNIKGDKNFRRVKIKPSDVIRPTCAMLLISFSFLLGWTLSPAKPVWTRTTLENYDSFGRNVASFGACRPADGSNLFLVFVIPLCLVNLVVVSLATLATHRGRSLPTEFSERHFLKVALVSVSETVLLAAVPILAVMDDPTAFFVVASLVICIGCMSILVPVFLPKWLQRSVQEPKGRGSNSLFLKKKKSFFNWRLSSIRRSTGDEPSSSTRIVEILQAELLATKPQKIKRVSTGSAASSNFSSPNVRFSIETAVFENPLHNQSTIGKAILEPTPPPQTIVRVTPPKRLAIVGKATLEPTQETDPSGSSSAFNPACPSLAVVVEGASSNESDGDEEPAFTSMA